ncbi:baeRF3 domain-containing protein [Nostoc sp.]|uniref:baeRF3 domain-containing protein n=1 Tax=Nostoc sp. TaxID=1180 RepID=UPI002FF6360E
MQLISKEEIKTLIEQPKGNCVSIYMPTHPAGPEVRQDPIRFKNLVREAEARLIDAGLTQEDAIALLEKSQELDTQEFWEQMGEQGLAIFISENIFRYYPLPIDFQELVVVTDRFHIKPLLPILNGNGRFYILALSQQDVRFFEGTRYSINEVEVENLPKSLDEALQRDDTAKEGQFRIATSKGGTSNPFSQPGSFHGQGSPDRDRRQEDILQFFQIVDRALHEKLKLQKAPLVLAGVEYLLPVYRQANTYQHLMDEAIAGNPEILSAQELHDQAWPIVEADFQKSQQAVLEQFHELFGGDTGKASNNLQEVISAAYYQRVDSLLVAVGQQQWGLFDPTSETVYLHPEKEAGDEDLLDFVAAHTLLNGGTVYAVPFEEIPYSTAVAAIYRY